MDEFGGDSFASVPIRSCISNCAEHERCWRVVEWWQCAPLRRHGSLAKSTERCVWKRYVGTADSNNDYLFQNTLNAKLLDVVLDHYERCPSLIFCTTRDAALKAAKKLEEDIRHRNAIRQAFVTDDQAKMKLVQAATRAKNKALKQLLQEVLLFTTPRSNNRPKSRGNAFSRESDISALLDDVGAWASTYQRDSWSFAEQKRKVA